MLGRFGSWLTHVAQRVVPHTMVIAVLLSLVTAAFCLLWTPVQPLELLSIWSGKGAHPLLRGSIEKPELWVVRKMEVHGNQSIRLHIWKHDTASEIRSLLQKRAALASAKFEIKKRTLLVSGIAPRIVQKELLASKIRAKTKGIWHFLTFAMQMCLILLCGYILAVSPLVMRGIQRAASLPKNAGAAAALVALVACVSGWLNWGFGLIVGAYFAREVGKQGEERGVPMHYPLLGAAGYTALLVWHGGMSGSAPLKVAEVGHLQSIGVALSNIPLSETVFSPLNLAVTVSLFISIPILCRAMVPEQASEMQPFSTFVTETQVKEENVKHLTQDSWLDTWYGINLLLAVPMLAFFALSLGQQGLRSLSINQVILLFLALGLLFHPGIKSMIRVASVGARNCTGILLQFPLYAGMFSMLYESGLVEIFAAWASQVGSATLFLVANFFSAGLLNVFIPSGGGQWGVQGSIVLNAAQKLQIAPGTSVMTVAYGDQWTNMLQPFWALALLEITGLKAKDIIAYTLLLMVITGFFFLLALVLFG